LPAVPFPVDPFPLLLWYGQAIKEEHSRNRWDKNLEKIAKDYASNCIWGHNLYRGFAGENLFARAENPSFMEAIKSWYSEIQHFSPAMMTCDSDETCGHYTQVVWANSRKVGCAIHKCPTMKKLPTFKDATFIVCNYLPPGNYIGTKPYKKGAVCSQCPTGYKCKDKLCSESFFIFLNQ
uniref:SCP domain-containing protein n=1 Tax=Callorhinchus milii TaxID=7868 RepID=A0A4W3GIJ4_CALMI